MQGRDWVKTATKTAQEAAKNPRVWPPVLVVAILLVGFIFPWTLRSCADSVRHYRVSQWYGLIDEKAEQAGVDPLLVRAVVLAESSGNPEAHSSAKAKGLMQITPITHEDAMQRFDLPDGDLFDPDYNLTVGTRYLAYLLNRFDDDVTLALAAYHMGPTRVSKLRRENPKLSPNELVEKFAGPKTKAYVKRVKAEAGL